MIGTAARFRRSLYGAGVLRSSSLPRPVVSVGNLTMGGSGKTPHVQHLADWLCRQGLRVAVLSRGYGRKTSGVVWASRGQGAGPEGGMSFLADRVGDEPALLASTLPGVAVLVGESRFAAGQQALRAQEIDVFLLDDGFQHLSLRRDADILLVDAIRGLGNRRSLPFGPLREPPDHACFADALVVTRCASLEQGKAAAASVPFPPGRPVAFTRLVPLAIVDREEAQTPLPPSGERTIAAFSGIARNDQFREILRASGFTVRTFLGFRDHYRYRPDDLERIRTAADGLPVVTTEKDLVRLPAEVPFPVAALRVGVEFLSGWEELSRLVLERIGRRGGR